MSSIPTFLTASNASDPSDTEVGKTTCGARVVRRVSSRTRTTILQTCATQSIILKATSFPGHHFEDHVRYAFRAASVLAKGTCSCRYYKYSIHFTLRILVSFLAAYYITPEYLYHCQVSIVSKIFCLNYRHSRDLFQNSQGCNSVETNSTNSSRSFGNVSAPNQISEVPHHRSRLGLNSHLVNHLSFHFIHKFGLF